jgi:hypothetical protein
MSIYSDWIFDIEGYGYLFLHRTGQGALSLLFPDDPGGRLPPPKRYRFKDVGFTFKAARPPLSPA